MKLALIPNSTNLGDHLLGVLCGKCLSLAVQAALHKLAEQNSLHHHIVFPLVTKYKCAVMSGTDATIDLYIMRMNKNYVALQNALQARAFSVFAFWSCFTSNNSKA